jgi:hypothetical protein
MPSEPSRFSRNDLTVLINLPVQHASSHFQVIEIKLPVNEVDGKKLVKPHIFAIKPGRLPRALQGMKCS